MAKSIEIRFELPRDVAAVLDAYCQARSLTKTSVIVDMVREWSEVKRHEWILGCRMLGINPVAPERDRS